MDIELQRALWVQRSRRLFLFGARCLTAVLVFFYHIRQGCSHHLGPLPKLWPMASAVAIHASRSLSLFLQGPPTESWGRQGTQGLQQSRMDGKGRPSSGTSCLCARRRPAETCRGEKINPGFRRAHSHAAFSSYSSGEERKEASTVQTGLEKEEGLLEKEEGFLGAAERKLVGE